ncbi:MAG: TetR/AcrR family transcriptional regulator C-terminal domain-containing protein [Clostridia bacterium]|nr:TetR/AcrR family transcriptional regulator C-terminal domain-containing protein [Clostridia bacterium]
MSYPTIIKDVMATARFTRQAIMDSFLKLLCEKPLDKITVKDIVEDCGVNRKTFYYYFQDIYALADQAFRAQVEKISEANPTGEYSLRESIKAFVRFIEKNRTAAIHTYRSMGFGETGQLLYRKCVENLPEYIKKRLSHNVPDEDVAILSQVYACAISGMLVRWMEGGMNEVPYHMIDRIFVLMDGMIDVAEKTGRD